MNKKIVSIEIFSGAGGLAKGIELAGATHKAFVEWNPDACKTLRLNYPPEMVHEADIRLFDFSSFKDVDIIAGGPPCQPFSLGGKAKGNKDERDMFPSAIAAIRNLKPKAFIFENVKGLLRESFRDYFNYILLQLRNPDVLDDSGDWRTHLNNLMSLSASKTSTGLQYDVQFQLVNAADYGVPQKRERVVIVGIRKDINVKWTFPEVTHSLDALLWDKYVSKKYWERHGIHMPTSEIKCAEIERNKLIKKYGMFKPELLPWKTIRDAISDLPHPVADAESRSEHTYRGGAKEYPGHTGSAIDMPSKTIKAGGHGVPGGENMVKLTDGSVRYLTTLEAKRIQTFPDDYPISGSWSEAMRQLGNAVPVRLSYIVASALFKTIFGHT